MPHRIEHSDAETLCLLAVKHSHAHAGAQLTSKRIVELLNVEDQGSLAQLGVVLHQLDAVIDAECFDDAS